MDWTANAPLEQHEGGEEVTVVSPLSDVVISRYDPKTGDTERQVCPACRRFIETDQVSKRGQPYFDHGVGDPVYFMGAGVKYWSLVVPRWGRIAFHRWDNWEAYRDYHPKNEDPNHHATDWSRFSPQQKRNWREETGVPFPYEYFD